MKTYFKSVILMLIAVSFWLTAPASAQKVEKAGKHVDVVKLDQRAIANGFTSYTLYFSIADYRKISLYIGCSVNDSIRLGYKVYLGSQGMWEKVADDSLVTTTGTAGVIATDCKVYTWDFGATVSDTGHVANSNKMKMERLNSDIKIVITKSNLGGNGVGTGSASQAYSNIYLIGQKPKD